MSIHRYIQTHFGPGWTLINYANPNAHGWLGHIEKDGEHVVFEEDPGFDPIEYSTDDRVEAQQDYDAKLNKMLAEPNWELQAAYDDMWGEPLEYNTEH